MKTCRSQNPASSSVAKGTGKSSEPKRSTGASRNWKFSSCSTAAISPPIPPVSTSSCSTNTRPVFRTLSCESLPIDWGETSQIDEFCIPILTGGQNVQCPMHPHSIGDQGELTATSQQLCFSDGCVKSVRCYIATNSAVKCLVFKKSTGFGSSSAAFKSPLASSGKAG